MIADKKKILRDVHYCIRLNRKEVALIAEYCEKHKVRMHTSAMRKLLIQALKAELEIKD